MGEHCTSARNGKFFFIKKVTMKLSDVGLYRVCVDDGVVVLPRVAVVVEVLVRCGPAALGQVVAAHNGRLCQPRTVVVQLKYVRH